MRPIPIIIETDDFLAVNKPPGLLSIPGRYDGDTGSVVMLLKKKSKNIFVVHRLDRLTSGILLFARNAPAHKYFSELFENRAIVKIYTGIVLGKIGEASGTVDAPIADNPYRKGEMMVHKRGKASVTGYEVAETFSHYSVVNFKPLTGRTHQIRVHARHINHPLACDPVYGDGKPVFLSSFKKNYRPGKDALEERPLLNRLALHAFSLSFKGPDQKDYYIEAPLPRDINAVIQQLRKN